MPLMDALHHPPMSRPTPTDDEFKRETVDRLRRLETRWTKFMEWSGFDTEVRRPSFSDGRLDIPTDAISLRDCLGAIPPEWSASVSLSHKGVTIATLTPTKSGQ